MSNGKSGSVLHISKIKHFWVKAFTSIKKEIGLNSNLGIVVLVWSYFADFTDITSSLLNGNWDDWDMSAWALTPAATVVLVCFSTK